MTAVMAINNSKKQTYSCYPDAEQREADGLYESN
jgi:hypothetical protein